MELRLGCTLPEDAVFIGSVVGGKVVAGVAFSHYSGHDIHLSLVAERGKGQKGLLEEVFHYVFRTAGCSRCTVLIRSGERGNKSRRLAQKLGFRKEGILRRYYGDEDADVFGLLKEELTHGLRRQAAQGARSAAGH